MEAQNENGGKMKRILVNGGIILGLLALSSLVGVLGTRWLVQRNQNLSKSEVTGAPQSSNDTSSSPLPVVVPDYNSVEQNQGDDLTLYENIKYGYKFKYPKNLVLSNLIGSDQLQVSSHLVLKDPKNPDPDEFWLTVDGADSTPESIDGWVEAVTDEIPVRFARKFTSTDPKIVMERYVVTLSKGAITIIVNKEAPKDLMTKILNSFVYLHV